MPEAAAHRARNAAGLMTPGSRAVSLLGSSGRSRDVSSAAGRQGRRPTHDPDSTSGTALRRVPPCRHGGDVAGGQRELARGLEPLTTCLQGRPQRYVQAADLRRWRSRDVGRPGRALHVPSQRTPLATHGPSAPIARVAMVDGVSTRGDILEQVMTEVGITQSELSRIAACTSRASASSCPVAPTSATTCSSASWSAWATPSRSCAAPCGPTWPAPSVARGSSTGSCLAT